MTYSFSTRSRVSIAHAHHFPLSFRSPLHALQRHHFATRQRPKSILSLSNPNRHRQRDTAQDDLSSLNYIPSHHFEQYQIQLFQYHHDPRAGQFRVLLDYFNIPYDCIEVTPFKKEEFKKLDVPFEHWHAPLLRLLHRQRCDDTVEKFKKESVLYAPAIHRHECLQIKKLETYVERTKQYIEKSDEKTPEQVQEQLQKFEDVFKRYEELFLSKYNMFITHSELVDKLLPLIENNLSNDQRRRMFNERCDRQRIEFYSGAYVYTLQACLAKSFFSCFQLMSYLKMFRKLRNWHVFKVEFNHFWCAIKFRVRQKRKYARKAVTGVRPKTHATRHTYEFLQTFHEDMPDLTMKGKIPDPDDQNAENTKQEISLIGKPFHGGRSPDILDLLVFGALKGVHGLDVYHHLWKTMIQLDVWYNKMKDEANSSACKHFI